MKVSAVLFIFWTVGVMLFWIGTTPESAPQQAALAGQVLVLICAPYCALSVIQRTWRDPASKHEQSGEALDLPERPETVVEAPIQAAAG